MPDFESTVKNLLNMKPTPNKHGAKDPDAQSESSSSDNSAKIERSKARKAERE